MNTFFKIFVGSLFLFFFSWFLLYKTNINTLPIQSEDTVPTMFLPLTLIKEHTFYLDTYQQMMIARYPHPDDKDYKLGLTPFYLKKIGTPTERVDVDLNCLKSNYYPNYYSCGRLVIDPPYHYVSAFPVVTALLALPVYFIFLATNLPVSWENLAILGHVNGALIMALAGGFFYLLLKNAFSLDEKKAKLVTYVYLFGTINFALISQAMWQHGTVQLFVILGLYFFFATLNFPSSADAKTKPLKRLLTLLISGLMFGLAILSRPTAVVFLPFVPVLLLWGIAPTPQPFIKRALKALGQTITLYAGIIPSVAFFVWYNNTYFKSFTNQGYVAQATSSWQSNIVEGFFGLWISPSKGMLVYSPVLVFALVGFWLVFHDFLKSRGTKVAFAGKSPAENWPDSLEYLVFMAVVIIHTLVLGKWKHWYGGWSYGYRMATDILPYLVLLMVPYVKSPLYEKTKKLFGLLFALSIAIEIYGLIFFDGIWHAAYDRGFKNTGWLWSIRNSEFAFNIRRILVKFGVLDRACLKCLPAILKTK